MTNETPGRAVQLNRRDFSNAEIEEKILEAFGRTTAPLTLSELMQLTGLPALTLEPVLRQIMLNWAIVVEMSASGELSWSAPDGLHTRIDSKELKRLKRRRKLMAIFKAIFKIGIVIALVGFFVILVVLTVLAIAVMLGMLKGGDNDNSSDKGSSSKGGSWKGSGQSDYSGNSGGSTIFVWPRIFGRGSRSAPVASRYASPPAEDPRGFVAKTYSYVFGPEEDQKDELYTEQQLLAWIAEERGLISPMELSARTGWSPRASEQESSRMIAQWDGSVDILPDGSTVFLFDNVTDKIAAGESPIAPFWAHYEVEATTTANTGTFNFLISVMNAFILVASTVLMPGFIAPTLGLVESLGPGVVYGLLCALPALYALTFFAVPLIRHFTETKKENAARMERNQRRVLLQEIYRQVSRGNTRLRRSVILDNADRARPADSFFPFPPLPALARTLDDIVHEWGASTDLADEDYIYDFSSLQTQLQQAQALRERSGDHATNRMRDQFAAFDQAVAGGGDLYSYDFAGAAMSHPDAPYSHASTSPPAPASPAMPEEARVESPTTSYRDPREF